MSESPAPSRSILIPLLAAGVHVALVVASWGFIGLVLDRDVIDDPALGPLIGPLAVAVSAVVVVFALRRALTSGRPWLAALAATAVALLAMGVVIGVGGAIGHGDAAWLVLSAGAAFGAPFIPVAAVLAGLGVVGGWALSRASLHDPR